MNHGKTAGSEDPIEDEPGGSDTDRSDRDTVDPSSEDDDPAMIFHDHEASRCIPGFGDV